MPIIADYVHRIRRFPGNARLFLAFSFLFGFSFAVYSLFFNLYIIARGYDSAFLGVLVALPMGMNLLFALPVGLFGNRIGYKHGLIIGAVAMTVSIVGVALSSGAIGLIAFSVLNGIGNSILWVMGVPFMAANSRIEERTHLFSMQFSLNTFSGFFGFLVGGVLPTMFAHIFRCGAAAPVAYQATLLASAGFMAIAVIPLALISEPPRAVHTAVLHIRAAFAQPTLIIKLLIPEIVIGLGAGLLVPYFNVFFKQQFAVSDGILGTLFAGQAVGIGIATLAGPLLAARWGKVRAVAITQFASIPFLLMLGYSPLFVVAVVGFLARAALMNMGGPLYSAFTMEKVEAGRRAAVNGLLTMSWSGSFAIANWISGRLQGTVGFSPLFLFTAVAYGIGAGLVYLFFARSRGDEA